MRVASPPPARLDDLYRVRDFLDSADRVVLTTHVNADGDGAGSEVAMARWLRARGARPTIVNPTPFPDAFAFLLDDLEPVTAGSDAGRAALAEADALLVLDTSEPGRMGGLAEHAARLPVAVIDHHPISATSVGEVVVNDPGACATGELVYDLLTLDGEELGTPPARALYVAIVTDTGSFRFGNTTARTHQVVAELLRAGVDVEAMFRRIFARYTPEGLDLLERALASLERSEDGRVAWITIRESDLRETGADAEDREGLVEYARRLDGVEVALLFREVQGGGTKISLRSNGEVDVAAVAQRFGGGGHRQAAGALTGGPLDRVREEAVRQVESAVEQL